MNNDETLRYPIGRFQAQPTYSLDDIRSNIDRITALPQSFEKTAMSLTSAMLATPYRDGGWTARQVIHHVADSHANAYIRTKWTLTEDTPLIKAYDEKAWANTAETALDPAMSLQLLKAIHQRWVALTKLLNETDFQRSFIHPETQKSISLAHQMALYAWHGEHHLGHLKIVLNK